MRSILGRPLQEALSSLSPDEAPPRVVITSAPRRDGETRREGSLRVVACRKGEWIAAPFLDANPERKNEA